MRLRGEHSVLGAVFDRNAQVLGRQRAARARRPFDQQHCALIEQVANAERFNLARAREPIQIDVIELQTCRFVRLDQRVGRTANRAFDADTCEDTGRTSTWAKSASSSNAAA